MSTRTEPIDAHSLIALAAGQRSRARALADATGMLVFVAFLCFNHFSATASLGTAALGFFICFAFACWSYGSCFRRLLRRSMDLELGLPFDLLAGFFLANTLLFIVSLALPFGMQVNAVLVLLPAVLLGGLQLRPSPKTDTGGLLNGHTPPSASLAGTIAIVVSAVAATLYCQQAQTVVVRDGLVVYQAWRDTFIHVREISAFAQAFGAGTLQDIKLAGHSVAIYHFASYLSPAAALAFTKVPAISLYASLQLPMGIFLTGIAAFCLASTFWGVWPAVAATVAIVVLPDAFQQGFANRYLSYNFLAQVNLGMLYGLACVSLAWMFMVLGCRRDKLAQVVLGYVFLVLCAFYKAHIFVANALLILMYPTVFFQRVPPRWRVVIGVVFLAVFVGAIWATQSHPRIPVIRLDGSGMSFYLHRLLDDFDAGVLKDFFNAKFDTGHSKASMGVYAVVLITLCTFGVWVLLAPWAWWRARKDQPWATLLFPIAIAGNYLVMSLGLALDIKQVGTLDELQNRPLVWAYFSIVLWAAGALYYTLLRNHPPRSRTGMAVGAVIIVVALAALGQFSKDLQTFPTRGYENFSSINGLPVCLVKAADYIRTHSPVGDLVQDSRNDPDFEFTALTERQLLAGVGSFGGRTQQQTARLAGLAAFLKLTQADEIKAFAVEQKIAWYLLHPATPVAWSPETLEHPAFACGGYRVFKFP